MCHRGSVCVWGERQRKDKTVSGRRKSHDDMLVIYSPTAGLGINIDLLQCCSAAVVH